MGVICLQGGNEFASAGATMDRDLLDRAKGGAVVVLPLAAAPGHEYETAGRNGVGWFRNLGAVDVTLAPDPRDGGDAATAVRRARLLFLPGGSPSRLLDALAGTGLDAAVRDFAARPDTVLVGASAGAMVLCEWTVLPDDGGRVTRGLGLLDKLAVVPHYDGGQADWVAALRGAAPETDVLGVPEASGVVVDGPSMVAVGAEPATLLTGDGAATLALDVGPV